jgi:hypothetical protein
MYDDILGAFDDDDDLMGEDLMGEDLMGEDLMGARRRGGSRVARRLARASMMPGVPSVGGRLQPVGFGSAVFSSTSGTTLRLTANPQRPLVLRKLVAAITRNGGSAVGAVTIDSIKVGSNEQLVNAQPTPAELFDPATQNNNIAFDASTPGVEVTITLSISAAPTATDTVTVAVGAIAETVG